MIRRLFRWVAPLLLLGLQTAAVHAQNNAALPGDDAPSKAPVLGYALAFAFILGTLVVLCMPSRKS